MALRCFIVDDSTHFLEAARDLLEHGGLDVVGVATTIEQALRTVDDAEPDVVLVDVNLGGESGLDLARRMPRATSVDPLKVILISTRTEEEVLDVVRTVPAAAFLSKTELSAVAIRRILDVG